MNIPMLQWFSTMPPERQLLAAAVLLLPLLANFLSIWHALQRQFPSPQEKLLWLGCGLFLPFLGGLPYWLLGARRGHRPVSGPATSPEANGSRPASHND